MGKIAKGPHTILAENVHLASNKRKMLFILRSSKTHHKGCNPQQIKITSTPSATIKSHRNSTHFCPYEILCDFLGKRPHAISDVEQFFVFSDWSPVSAEQIRKILHMLRDFRLGLQSHLYNVHLLRIGRCIDLLNWGVSVETIKKLGRWKSNAVFTYLKE